MKPGFLAIVLLVALNLLQQLDLLVGVLFLRILLGACVLAGLLTQFWGKKMKIDLKLV